MSATVQKLSDDFASAGTLVREIAASIQERDSIASRGGDYSKLNDNLLQKERRLDSILDELSELLDDVESDPIRYNIKEDTLRKYQEQLQKLHKFHDDTSKMVSEPPKQESQRNDLFGGGSGSNPSQNRNWDRSEQTYLLKEQNKRISDIGKIADNLYQYSEVIHDELVDQNKLLGRIDHKLSNTTTKVHKETFRTEVTTESTGTCKYWIVIFILFIIIIILVVLQLI